MPGLRPVPIGGGFGSRRRKGHLPKVCLRRKKCERHDGLSAAPWPKRHHSAFRFLLAVLVSQDECLPDRQGDVQNRKPTVPAHGKRAGPGLEPLVLSIDSLHGQIDEDEYADGSTAFAVPAVKGGPDQIPFFLRIARVLRLLARSTTQPGIETR